MRAQPPETAAGAVLAPRVSGRDGHELAQRCLAQRRQRLAHERSAAALQAAALHGAAVTALPGEAGDLIALGDAWLACWPDTDVPDRLAGRHGFGVESCAKAGTRLQHLLQPQAGGSGQLGWLLDHLAERSPERRARVRAIVLSAGLHDLFDAKAPWMSADAAGLQRYVDEALAERLAQLLIALTDLCQATLATRLPILLLGYACPVPDGRASHGPGPWLRPQLLQGGHRLRSRQLALLGRAIDAFNQMQLRLLADSAFAHVRHVDLRGLLRHDRSHYQQDWRDELHPSAGAGADRIADALAQALTLGSDAAI